MRTKLREEIADTLALFAGLARQAVRETPELKAVAVPPGHSTSNQTFLTRGRVAVATATTHRELLGRYGMPESFPGELDAILDQFEAALNQKHAGQAAHIGAHAELKAVTTEIMDLVRHFDTLHRYQYRNDAEALGAWRSARNVAWPLGGKDERPAA